MILHRVRTVLPIALVIVATLAASRKISSSAPVARLQTPASTTPTGLIIGRVVEAGGSTPIGNVIVSLTGPGVGSKRVIVDPQGRFMFSDLPAGAFTIAATKRGYLDGAFGKQRPDGQGSAIELHDNERVTDLVVKMWRAAAISGTVTDDAGDPVGTMVQVWRRTVNAGHWRLTYAGQSEYADERGGYRVVGLPPGDYAVVITSLTSTLPASLLTATALAKTAEGPARDEFMKIANTNGTGGYVSDLSQGFATVRVGDMLLQGGRTPTVNDGRTVNIYPTVWYPSATSPSQATIITLGPGDDRTDIDLHLTLTSGLRITGTVTGPEGPVPWLALRLVPAALDDVTAEVTTSLSQSFNVAMTASDANGEFTFLAVPPGQYIIRGLTTPRPLPEPAAPTTVIQTADGMSQAVGGGPRLPPMLSKDPSLWTAVPVSVGDKDVTGVAVTMSQGLHVTGRVEFDGTAAKPVGNALRAIRVSLESADGRIVWGAQAYQGQVDPNGEFYTAGVMAGSYLLRVDAAPPGWSVKSAMIGGRDMCDTPIALDRDMAGLVLTFTDRPSRLTGTVRDDQGHADGNASVVIMPGDGAWVNLGTSPRRLRNVRVSPSGAYSIAALPPGTYNIVAINDAQASNWQDPAFLQKLARVASKVTIGDGQNQSMDLTTVVVR